MIADSDRLIETRRSQSGNIPVLERLFQSLTQHTSRQAKAHNMLHLFWLVSEEREHSFSRCEVASHEIAK